MPMRHACLRAVLRHPYIHGLRIRILLTILLLTTCHCCLSLSPKYFTRARKNPLLHLRQHPLFPRPQRAAISARGWQVRVGEQIIVSARPPVQLQHEKSVSGSTG